jgi:carboxyl-terminal processing protease
MFDGGFGREKPASISNCTAAARLGVDYHKRPPLALRRTGAPSMNIRDPKRNFEELWETFQNRYPFFELRKVDWKVQYDVYRPMVTADTSDEELFDIFCLMLSPLHDGHVELKAKASGDRKTRYFNPELKPRFWKEFSKREIKELFKTTGKTLAAEGFGRPAKTRAWMLRYRRSRRFGYLRILELEGIKRRRLIAALDKISRDFHGLDGMIIDIRNNPGGDDSTVITIVNRFCDRKRIAFHRKTKIGPADSDFTALKTWRIKPRGDA